MTQLEALRAALSNLIAMAQPFMTDAPQQLALEQARAALETASTDGTVDENDPNLEAGWLENHKKHAPHFERADTEFFEELERRKASTDGDGCVRVQAWEELPSVDQRRVCALLRNFDLVVEEQLKEAKKVYDFIRALSPAPAIKVGHTGPNGERLSAPDLAHRFVAETYDYQPQDPMARYLRERFTEYIEIDRAMAPAAMTDGGVRATVKSTE